MSSYGKVVLSSNSTDIAFVAIVTFDLMDNIFSVIHFEFFGVQNEYSRDSGRYVCDRYYFISIFDARKHYFVGFDRSIFLLFNSA